MEVTGVTFSLNCVIFSGSITSAMGMDVSCFIMNVTFSDLNVTFSAMGVTFSAMDNQCDLIANLPEGGYKDFDSFSHFPLW